MIDPVIEGMLNAMAAGGFRLPDPLEAASLRAMLDVPIPAPPVEIAEKRNLSMGSDGSLLSGRLYHPEPGEILPVILFFHGGGWVHGTLDTHDRLCAALAVQARSAVVSVDYRLAPEHRFPAAWEDAIMALRWLKDHHSELGVDAGCIAVAGDSAGGNLAAALAQAAAGDPAIVHQLLFYPVLEGACEKPSFAKDHPELFAEIQNDAAASERARIQGVEAQSMPGHEALINTLKFDGKTTGPEAAVQILQAHKGKLAAKGQALADDAAAIPALAPSTDAAADAAAKAAADNALPIDDRCKKTWEADAGIRQEFGTLAAYTAYEKAMSGGKVRQLADRVQRAA